MTQYVWQLKSFSGETNDQVDEKVNEFLFTIDEQWQDDIKILTESHDTTSWHIVHVLYKKRRIATQ